VIHILVDAYHNQAFLKTKVKYYVGNVSNITKKKKYIYIYNDNKIVILIFHIITMTIPSM